MPAERQIIYLQQAAPAKPRTGAACNGCGVCCAAATCPVARMFLWQWRGACRALLWQANDQRYYCGLVQQPQHYLRWLPHSFAPVFGRWVLKKIAANSHCDSDVETGK
jgi:hypothetical protein